MNFRPFWQTPRRFATDVRVLVMAGLGKAPLVGGSGVAHEFRKARVARNRPDLMGGAAGLGQRRAAALRSP